MKESYSFLRTWLKPFAVTLAFIYSPQLTLAADIDIATSFPDAKVQEVLLTYDTSGEGILQESEQTFTSLDLSNKGVTNLKGVELLTQLTSLYVNGNADLKSISIKKLINLKNLSVQGTGLTSLDISGLTELTYLFAYGCPNLATITAVKNEIESSNIAIHMNIANTAAAVSSIFAMRLLLSGAVSYAPMMFVLLSFSV